MLLVTYRTGTASKAATPTANQPSDPIAGRRHERRGGALGRDEVAVKRCEIKAAHPTRRTMPEF
jgi:hypothetical protein